MRKNKPYWKCADPVSCETDHLYIDYYPETKDSQEVMRVSKKRFDEFGIPHHSRKGITLCREEFRYAIPQLEFMLRVLYAWKKYYEETQ